jgi:hypothetical protein
VAAWPAFRFANGSRPITDEARAGLRFALGWVAVVLWFFVVSQCRLPPYSLPALPALALLIAYGWRSLGSDSSTVLSRRLAQGCAAFFAFTATALLVAGTVLWTPVASFLGSGSIARLGAVVLCFIAIAGWMAVFALRKGRAASALILLGLAAVTLCIGGAIGLAVYQSGRSFDRVIQALPPDRGPGSVIVLDHPEEYETVGALCFYSRDRVLVLERPGRPTSANHHGLSERFFIGPDELRALWNSNRPVYFISDIDANPGPPIPGLERLRSIGRAQDRRLYANR